MPQSRFNPPVHCDSSYEADALQPSHHLFLEQNYVWGFYNVDLLFSSKLSFDKLNQNALCVQNNKIHLGWGGWYKYNGRPPKQYVPRGDRWMSGLSRFHLAREIQFKIHWKAIIIYCLIVYLFSNYWILSICFE